MRKKILLIFHNLNIEGAPTMLINAAKVLVGAGYSVSAVSLVDGVYRKELDRLNIPIEIWDSQMVNIKTDKYIMQFNLWWKDIIIQFRLCGIYMKERA